MGVSILFYLHYSPSVGRSIRYEKFTGTW